MTPNRRETMSTEAEDDVPTNLTIRGLPADVRRKLAARADARGISLNAYLVERLTLHVEMLRAQDRQVAAERKPGGGQS
jgi:predicted HicB family RNase H-like nuclease